MSGGHCTHPNGGPAIRLKHKKKLPDDADLYGRSGFLFLSAIFGKIASYWSLDQDALSIVQFLQNGVLRITFKKTRIDCDRVVSSGIRFRGNPLRVASTDARGRMTHLRNCPAEVPDDVVRRSFTTFAEVHAISGYFVVLARNCLAHTLDYIVMQIKKVTVQRGDCDGSRVLLFSLPLLIGRSSLGFRLVFHLVSCLKTVLQGIIDSASNYVMSQAN